MRRFLLHSLLAATMAIGIFLLPGCAEQPITPPVASIDTLRLTPPDPGQGFQVVLGPFDIPSGQEIIKNFYQKIPLDSEAYVSLIQVKCSQGGHYTNIFKSDVSDVPDHVEDTFNPVEWDKWDLMTVALQEKYTLKFARGAAMRLMPRQQMNFQTHFINNGAVPMRGKVVINIWTTTQKKDVQYPIGILYADNQDIKIPPHTSATYCKVLKPFDKDIQIMVMAGRFHSRGKKMVLGPWDGKQITEPMYINQSWEKPSVLDLACSATIPANDSLAFITTFENPTDTEISFGPRTATQEQSGLYLYYSPGPENGKTIYDFTNAFLMETHPL